MIFIRCISNRTNPEAMTPFCFSFVPNAPPEAFQVVNHVDKYWYMDPACPTETNVP